MPIGGTGFTPAAFITMGGDAFGSVQADGAGTVAGQVSAPVVRTIAPTSVAVGARDGANAAITAQTSFLVVRDLYVTNAPLSGRPRQRTTWRFAGFSPGRPIYGHFRFRGRTQRNYRCGVAAGPGAARSSPAPAAPRCVACARARGPRSSTTAGTTSGRRPAV